MQFEHIEFLVEETSAEAALRILLPKFVSSKVTYRIHPFQGKPDLFKHLHKRLLGYSAWLPSSHCIIVLFDEDRQDCIELKSDVERIAQKSGFFTKSSPAPNGEYQIVFRICVEELEAWLLGDITAIKTAYPRVPATLGKRQGYRNPDAISGGTWEALERVLQKGGYHTAGLSKTQAARDICAHMQPERNTSHSFCLFRDTLKTLTS